MPILTHGSLFSGIGGFEEGARRSGIKTIWSCEFEPFQRSILRKHYKESKQYEDIRTAVIRERVNIISGGFPCQDISVAGKMEGINGSRSGLWSEMFRVIRNLRPEYVIIENSPALLIRGFERVLCDLSQIGYMQSGKLYLTSLLDIHTKEKGCMLLPTPTKSDYKATFAQTEALNRYLKSGHQIRMMDILCQKGFTKSDRVKLFEMAMGFNLGHTESEVSGMQ